MTVIRPSADLRNNYNEISKYCHEYSEPVFITKNGRGDLAVMSMELFDSLKSKLELHALIEEGLEADRNGKVIPYKEGLNMIRKEIKG